MALFKPYRVTSAQLNSLPIVEGQFIFVTDTKDLYFDVSTTDRLRLNADALTKLAGIENNANNYTLPVASSTLGGVRTTSTQSDLTNYEAAPIQNGVVYIKNAPTVTEFDEYTAVFHYTGNGEINFESTAIDEEEKGAANGVATLDANRKLTSSQLPLGETSSTAYRGDRGAAAYAHAVTNKGSAFASGLYKITTNAQGHVTAATAVTKADILNLGITDQRVIVSATQPSNMNNGDIWAVLEVDE